MSMIKQLLLLVILLVVAISSLCDVNKDDSGGSLLQTFWEENVVPVVGENDFYQLMLGKLQCSKFVIWTGRLLDVHQSLHRIYDTIKKSIYSL